MSTSSQYLSVPQSSYRPSQHRNNDHGPRRPAQSPEVHRHSVAAGHAASSSKVKLEDTPLGIHTSLGTHVPHITPAPTQTSPVQIVRTLSPTAASSFSATLSHTQSSPPESTVQYHSLSPSPRRIPLTFAPTKKKTVPTLPAQTIPCDAVPRATTLSAIRPVEPLVHFWRSTHARRPQPGSVPQGLPATHI
jgi:hypothetical protein